MDHDEVREQLELAAVEPEGIDRLMAGDTLTAQAVVGHVAGCPACAEELVRLRRASELIRDTVRSIPPPELRERTLAHVREYGRVHVGGAERAGGQVAEIPTLPVGAARNRRPGVGRIGWVAAIAAAVAVSVVSTAVVLDTRFDERLAASERSAQGLARVTTAAVALGTEEDVTRVELGDTGETGAPVEGTLLFSPSNAEVVVIATGLVEPAADREYRCWVEVDGQREPVGKMFFGADLAFWAGRVDAVAGLPEGATFGVSLVDASGDALDSTPVLVGRVGG